MISSPLKTITRELPRKMWYSLSEMYGFRTMAQADTARDSGRWRVRVNRSLTLLLAVFVVIVLVVPAFAQNATVEIDLAGCKITANPDQNKLKAVTGTGYPDSWNLTSSGGCLTVDLGQSYTLDHATLTGNVINDVRCTSSFWIPGMKYRYSMPAVQGNQTVDLQGSQTQVIRLYIDGDGREKLPPGVIAIWGLRLYARTP